MELLLCMILYQQYAVCYPHEEGSADLRVQSEDLVGISQTTTGTTTSQPSKPVTLKDLLNESPSPMENCNSEGVFLE